MHTHLGFSNTDNNLVVIGNNPNTNNFNPSIFNPNIFNSTNNTNSSNQHPKKIKYKKQYRELKQQFEELECEFYDTQILYDDANTRMEELEEQNEQLEEQNGQLEKQNGQLEEHCNQLEEHCNQLEEHCNQIEEEYSQLKETYNDFKNSFQYHMMEQGNNPFTLNDINHLEEIIESLTNQLNYAKQDYDIAISELKAQEEELFKLREINVSIESELNLDRNEIQNLKNENHNVTIERNKYQSQVAELTEEIEDNIKLQRKITKLESENTILENTNYSLNQQNELMINQNRELKNVIKRSGDNIMAYITKSRNTDKLIKDLRDENGSLIKKNTLLIKTEKETKDCILGYQAMVEELKQRLLEYKIIEEERQEISTQVTEKNIEDEYDIELETWEICELEEMSPNTNSEDGENNEENDENNEENDENNEENDEENDESNSESRTEL